MGFVEALRQVAVAADRPLHQLREEGHEQRQLEEILLHRLLIPIHIDDVAHSLKGVEGNTHGHDHIHQRQLILAGQEGIDVGNDKVGILGHRQNSQIEDQAKQQQMPLFRLHLRLVGLLLLLVQLRLVGFQILLLLGIDLIQQAADTISRQGRHTDEQQIHWVRAPVKNIAGHQKQGPLGLFRHQIVSKEHHRHKGDECIGRKQHSLFVCQPGHQLMQSLSGVEVFGDNLLGRDDHIKFLVNLGNDGDDVERVQNLIIRGR